MDKRINGEEIIKALHIIKKVCDDNVDSKNGSCKHCPFSVNGVCAITDLQPTNWSISEYTKFQALN